ncbi:MAG TPA: PQQ-binding-like beta-propeller repeat protein [Chthonomonadaceae bacterium]|nr:PQQ-binding-like beta-propeller repeat protein [Chthonomonadaceae bacterium]
MKRPILNLTAPGALALVGLIMIAPGGRTAAQAQGAREGAPVLIPGGVVDPNGQTAYLANTVHEGISAVDLQTGKVLWQARGPIKPLLVTGQKLIGWRPVEYAHNGLRVWALDTRTGRTTWSSQMIVLPSSVFVDSDSPVKPPFAMTAQMQNGRLLLLWAVPAPAAGETQNVAPQSGVMGVDLQTGAMIREAGSAAAAPKAAWMAKAVVGPRVFTLVEKKAREGDEEAERLVRAADRRTGKTLWEFPIGEP